MSYFNTDKAETTIKIKQGDLDETEKVEKFVSLFGRQNYTRARLALSEKRFGDGTIQKIQNKMANLNLNNEEELQQYEQYRATLKKESSLLQSKDEAFVEVPIYDSTKEKLFANRDVAKNYLGPHRYSEAVFQGREQVTDKNLREQNPHIRKIEQQNESITQKLKELEEKRNKLLEEQQNL